MHLCNKKIFSFIRYGLREFVVIHPAKTSDAIMTEDRTKMLLSSVYIAVNNTNW